MPHTPCPAFNGRIFFSVGVNTKQHRIIDRAEPKQSANHDKTTRTHQPIHNQKTPTQEKIRPRRRRPTAAHLSPAPHLISCALPQRRTPPPAARLTRSRSRATLGALEPPRAPARHHAIPITYPKPHLPDHTYRHTHSSTYNHAYSGSMSNARYRKSRCSVSRFSATVSSLVMCVIPVNGKYVCSRPAAISACESRSEWAMVTLSSEKP